MQSNPVIVGEVLIFLGYRSPEDGDVFARADRIVVAAVNHDGGLQCFPCNGHVVTGVEGDTVFPGEYLRTSPTRVIGLPHPWNTVRPATQFGASHFLEADCAAG